MTDLQKAAEAALEALDWYVKEDDVIESMAGNEPWVEGKRNAEKAIQTLRQAIAQPEQESVACVYKATNHYGETAHFGVRSAAKAWAKNGTVKAVPIKNLKLVQKPCLSCESLARTVMLDQTYHENIIEQQKQKPVVYQCPRCAASMEINTMAKPSLPKREWVGLTGFEQKELMEMNARDAVFATEAKLREKNA